MLVGTTGATKDGTYGVASKIHVASFGVYFSVALTSTVKGANWQRMPPLAGQWMPSVLFVRKLVP